MTDENDLLPNATIIEMIVGGFHALISVEEVRDEIESRIPSGVTTDTMRKSILDYAEKVHLQNRQLYFDVVNANIQPKGEL